MDEQKDLSVNNEENLSDDDVSNSDNSVSDDNLNVEENANDENVSNDSTNLGNGYRGLASSNREAFSRGLSDNYNERIARNKANLDAARARAANPKKTQEVDNGDSSKSNSDADNVQTQDKTKLDKAKDRADVLRNKAELASSKIDKARSGMYAVTNPKEAAKMAIKAKIRTWILASIVPITIGCISLFVLFVGVLFILGLFEGGSSSSGSNVVYEAGCNYEDTKVTVMDGSNTKVLATISLEDYIIGVACVEIGACDGASSYLDEDYVKAQYIASKTYALSRGGYNSSTKNIIVKASTRDQQWCDLDTGCIMTEETDTIFHNTYPGDYEETQMVGSVYGTRSFTEEDLEIFHRYYQETYGELFLSSNYNESVTSLGSDTATQYKSSTQSFWKQEADKGSRYDTILIATGSADVNDSEDYVGKSIYKLGSYCASSVKNGNLVALAEYPDYASVGAKEKVTKPISTLLSSDEINKLNSYVQTTVDQAGYGTGEAVAAAGQSLVYGLYQYGYYLPYWFGGGHTKGLTLGVDVNWGSDGLAFDPSWVNKNYYKGRYYYSYDCSGFVSWAIKNSCKSNYGGTDSSGFAGYGYSISLADAKPGDLMVKSGSHVRLIVKNTGDGVIVAESTSGYVDKGGIIFVKYSSAGDYKIVDMKNWYASNCNNSR